MQYCRHRYGDRFTVAIIPDGRRAGGPEAGRRGPEFPNGCERCGPRSGCKRLEPDAVDGDLRARSVGIGHRALEGESIAGRAAAWHHAQERLQ